jgi:hypothetical protein
MLVQEARWFAEAMTEMDDGSIFPMLNIGSHTEEYRRQHQPWIDEYIFGPLRARQRTVKHLDIRSGGGVDIVGDLTNRSFLKELAAMRFKSVFSANLLEHVVNRQEIAAVIASVVPVGGYVFVSCPHTFPFHADPIDTMFRPGIGELAALFPGTVVCRGAIVDCGSFGSYVAARFWGHPGALVRTLLRKSSQVRAPDGLGSIRHLLPWTFRRFRETCLVLRKDAEAGAAR